MPNWCANSLTVEGPGDILAKFRELTLNDELGENPTGNKSFCFDEIKSFETEIIIDDSDKLRITFNTRWVPPEGWIRDIIHKFGELKFTLAYCEIGMQFYGKVIIYKKNEKTKFIYKKYEMTSEDYGYYIEEGNGYRETTEEDETDGNYDEIMPKGRLKKYFDRYQIPHMGG